METIREEGVNLAGRKGEREEEALRVWETFLERSSSFTPTTTRSSSMPALLWLLA